MSNFFTVKTDAASISEGTGGSYINKSGIYDVILKTVSVKVNESNARSLNFNVDYKGSSQVFYGLKLDNNDGKPNFQAKVFNKLCNVVGLEAGPSDPETQTHKLGKDGVETDLSVLADFDDVPVRMRIQLVYSRWNGEIRENKEIKGFYRAEDGASEQEILQGGNPGEQLSKILEYADKDVYRDGLTAEDISAWLKAKKEGRNPADSKPASTNTFAGGVSPFSG